MARNINPAPQYRDRVTDEPLSGGKMFYFVSNTTTPKDTFADVNETILNENPVILDGSGTLPNVFFTGTARQVLENADGVQQWERDPVGDGSGGGSFSEWSSIQIYSENDVVIYQDEYYRSLTDGNQNNEPDASPENWVQVQFLENWNSTLIYDDDDIVVRSGRIYESTAGSNQSNDPLTSTLWRVVGFDADGVIDGAGSLVFDGFGVVNNAVTRPSTGVIRVVFEKAASAADKQVITSEQGTPNGSDIYAVDVQVIDETTVDLHCYFINGTTGEYTKQNNNGLVTLRRTLIS